MKVLTHESVTQAATCNLLPFVNKLKCIEKGINNENIRPRAAR